MNRFHDSYQNPVLIATDIGYRRCGDVPSSVEIDRLAGRGETIDSLAVLPFVNASGDPNAEYLSDAITESLINSLFQLPHLKVMSRDSAFMYKRKETDARTVGQTLGVRAVLKRHVMQRGDDLEIVNARDDSHIWGDQYSRKSTDIFALQGELAQEMTTMLRMRLTGEDEKRVTRSYTVNPEAYQDYLKGRYWWNKATKEGLNKVIAYFQQAIAKDPNYALAYAGLADCYTVLANFGFVPPQEAYPRARELALKALEIDDTLAEAHTLLDSPERPPSKRQRTNFSSPRPDRVGLRFFKNLLAERPSQDLLQHSTPTAGCSFE